MEDIKLQRVKVELSGKVFPPTYWKLSSIPGTFVLRELYKYVTLYHINISLKMYLVTDQSQN